MGRDGGEPFINQLHRHRRIELVEALLQPPDLGPHRSSGGTDFTIQRQRIADDHHRDLVVDNRGEDSIVFDPAVANSLDRGVGGGHSTIAVAQGQTDFSGAKIDTERSPGRTR